MNNEAMRMVKRNKKNYRIVKSVRQGISHVNVVLECIGSNGIIVSRCEAYGGFSRKKDFNYAIAEHVAIDNAVSQDQRYDY